MTDTVITVCTTCDYADPDAVAAAPDLGAPPPDPVKDGERLLAAVGAAAAGAPGVRVRGVACLMGCSHGCNAAISGDGKMSYVLGGFEPGEEAAEALVEYATKHAEQESGVVPFRQWPQGVKGHFKARIPPLD